MDAQNDSVQPKSLIARLAQWGRSKPFIYYPVHYVNLVAVRVPVVAVLTVISFVRWHIYKAFVEFNRCGLNTSEHRDKRIIVSLTSFPGRIDMVPYVITSLLNQTVKPDKIILWLGIEKFPDKKLPDIFDEVKACGVDIEFREDLGPHTKYFYAFKEYPEDIIITFDDDWIYDRDVIECLYSSYRKNPDCVHSMRVEEIKFLNDGSMAPCNTFDFNGGIVGHASHRYMASGVSGVLYPPHSVNNEVFNLAAMKKLSSRNDDIWLRIMEMLNDTRTLLVAHRHVPGSGVPGFIIYGSQASALWKTNVRGNENDIQMKAVLDAYNTRPSNGKTLLEMMREDSKV